MKKSIKWLFDLLSFFLQIRKNEAGKNEILLGQIQDMLKEDNGWKTEENMLKEMADFRKARLGLRRIFLLAMLDEFLDNV